MPIFLKKVLLFSLPVLVLMIVCEYMLRVIPNDYAYKRKYLDENSSKIEVLFLGSSHIYYGVDPTYISRKSFNAAHISQSLNLDLAILKKYGNNWQKLKYIVVPIDYFSLHLSLERSIEKWRLKNYYIYYNINIIDNYWNTFELFNGKLPNNLNRLKKYLSTNKSDITCNTLGFGTNYNANKAKDLITTGKTAAQRHTMEKDNEELIYSNSQIVYSLVKFAQQHNAKIIFITCPAYKSYRQNIDSTQLKIALNLVKEVTSKNANSYYYNLLADTSFVAQDYYDADHLNEIGAKKLTLKIDSIISLSSGL
jgi:hypothetical protein